MQLHTKKNPPKNLKDEIAKSRYTVDMWVAPEKWDLSIRRNVLCEICHHSISFVPSIDALCSLCNVVAHITCLNEAQRKQTFRNCWICTDCNDDLAYSKKKFITKKIDDNYKKVSIAAQITISKSWRRVYERRRYLRILGLIIRLQRIVQTMYRRNMLVKFRQSLPRAIYLNIVRCTNLPKSDWDTGKTDPYVLITVLDVKEENNQLWSFCTDVIHENINPQYNDVFLVPGITGNQLLVFTVIDQDANRDQCVGQAVLSMSTAHVWRKGGRFTLPLGSVKFTPSDIGRNVRIDYSTIKPQGNIEIEIQCNNALSDFCGYVYGPSVEDLKRVIRHEIEDGIVTDSGDNSLPKHAARIHSSVSIPSKKVWIVIMDGKLFLHRAFGAPCKVMIEVGETSLGFFVNHKKIYAELVLSLPGLNPLTFSAVEVSDGDTLKTSFLMSWKYTRQKGQAFSVAALVSDLAKIQASLKANPSTQYSHDEPSSESADNSSSHHNSSLSKDDKDSNVAAIIPLAKSSHRRRSVIIMGDVPKVVPVHTSLATLYKKSHEAESENDTLDLHLREQYDKKIKNSILRTRSPNNVHGKKGVSVQPLQDDDKRLRLAFGASQFGIYLMPENVDSPIESLKARPAVTL